LFLRTLRRRKWTVLVTVLTVCALAMTMSFRQQSLYEASADVLIGRQNPALTLTGVPDPAANQQAPRVSSTQAYVAGTPEVAQRVLRAQGLSSEMTPRQFLATSSVTPRPDSDVLVFRVRNADPDVARRLATEYAWQFTQYRTELDTEAYQRAREEIEGRLEDIRNSGQMSSTTYERLQEQDQQLRTMEALQSSNAFLLRQADQAFQVQPRPLRDGALAFVLAIMLGVGAAFLREALDTRIRSAEEAAEYLGVPLLARVSAPPRRRRKSHRLVMVSRPESGDAEAFRMLRTNLQFVTLEEPAQTILVTSALQQEGKSTTVANLAVALALSGRRVVIVDLDLRRPSLHKLFDLEASIGLTDVALGTNSLEEALMPVPLVGGKRGRRGKGSDGDAPADVLLDILPAGPAPPNVGEFVGMQAVADILNALRSRADVVLIDAPPMLHVGDAMTLSSRVDGLIVVSRLSGIRRPQLAEASRILAASRARVLGLVATGAEQEDEYGTYTYPGRAYGNAPARAHEEVRL
jgi:non-specific protein-tyrosine kinase